MDGWMDGWMDVLTMLPAYFGMYRPLSGQYFTEIPGNYNMSYIQLKRLLCVAARNVKTIKCVLGLKD
jgi:hypothetical protein